MSAPPGKRGGAVSGAGPGALVSSAQNSATSKKDIRTNRSTDDGFCAGTTFPPVQIAIPKHTNASSWEPTGGQTRCDVVREQKRKESAERGTVSQSRRQANLNSEIRRAVTISRVQEESDVEMFAVNDDATIPPLRAPPSPIAHAAELPLALKLPLDCANATGAINVATANTLPNIFIFIIWFSSDFACRRLPLNLQNLICTVEYDPPQNGALKM